MTTKTEFTFEQACAFLETDDFQLERDIINNKIRVGVYAKNWSGHCVNDIPENKEVNFNDLIEFELSQFWYLSNDNAASIVLGISPPENELTIFSPLKGEELSEALPETFTSPNFKAVIMRNYQDIGIRKQDLVFQLVDLQESRQVQPNKTKLVAYSVKDRFYFKKGGDDLAQLMRVYFYEFIIENDKEPTVHELWNLMIIQCKHSPESLVYYQRDSKTFYLENASEDRESVDFPAFRKRFNRYTKP